MATTEELPREAWRPYFDDLSRALGTVKATVEVIGPDIGSQIADENLVLLGVTYDDRDDVVMIALDAPGKPRGDLEHLVEHPRHIFVATGEGAGAEMAIDIQDGEEHQTIIRMDHVPELPPA